MLDTKTMKQIAVAIEEAIKGVASSHDVSIKIKGYSYGASTTKITLEVVGGDASVEPSYVQVFRDIASEIGMSPSDLGKEFTLRGSVYAIIGGRPRAEASVLAKKVGKELKSIFCFRPEEILSSWELERGCRQPADDTWFNTVKGSSSSKLKKVGERVAFSSLDIGDQFYLLDSEGKEVLKFGYGESIFVKKNSTQYEYVQRHLKRFEGLKTIDGGQSTLVMRAKYDYSRPDPD